MPTSKVRFPLVRKNSDPDPEVLPGYVKTHIILPSTIYGIVSTPLVDLGVQNPRSQQIPALVNASLDRKQGGMVGGTPLIYCSLILSFA